MANIIGMVERGFEETSVQFILEEKVLLSRQRKGAYVHSRYGEI